MTTPRELITGALRLINVVQSNESPTADDMDISFEALNAMLDSWSNEKLSIYSMNPYIFQFAAGQKDYTLGPGGDWDIARPMELQMMYVMYSPNGGECIIPTPPPPSSDYTLVGQIVAYQGFDGWVGIFGHIGDTPPFEANDLVYEQADNPSGSFYDLTTSNVDILSQEATTGAGSLTGTPGMDGPMNVSEVRDATGDSNDDTFLAWSYYFPMRVGDSIWIVDASFAYDDSFYFEVVVGPDMSNGEHYICEGVPGMAEVSPPEITLTRLADVGTR